MQIPDSSGSEIIDSIMMYHESIFLDLCLSDKGSLGDLPTCTGKPNFQLAQSAWCGQQQEPVACFKDTDSFLAKEN